MLILNGETIMKKIAIITLLTLAFAANVNCMFIFNEEKVQKSKIEIIKDEISQLNNRKSRLKLSDKQSLMQINTEITEKINELIEIGTKQSLEKSIEKYKKDLHSIEKNKKFRKLHLARFNSLNRTRLWTNPCIKNLKNMKKVMEEKIKEVKKIIKEERRKRKAKQPKEAKQDFLERINFIMDL